jgi:hypothetical protein
LSTFDRFGGRESPARSALTLILDGSSASTLSVIATVERCAVGVNGINLFGNVSLGGYGHLIFDILESHELVELFDGEVGEFVVSSGVGVVTSGGVDLFDESIKSHVLSKSVLEFFDGSVGFVPFSNVLHELELLSGERSGDGNSGEGGESERLHNFVRVLNI